MGKGSKRQRKDAKNPRFNNRPRLPERDDSFREEDMDDEVDAFHKQRDVVPIDVNRHAGDASDEEEEQPVFDFEVSDKDSDDNSRSSSDDDDKEEVDAIPVTSKEYARMLRQKKILQQKYGDIEDDVYEDTEQEEEQKAFFGRGKQFLYGADNVDFEMQSDEEDLAEEEAMAVLSQKEKAKSFSLEDFGLEDTDKEESEDDGQEQMPQDISIGVDFIKKSCPLLEDDSLGSYVEIKQDLNALSQEQQMDIVQSFAPELLGLLSELDEIIDQLSRLKVLLSKARENKGALNYIETKHKLLLAYLQAITFYLLLKSEGHSVRDHPVIARLVEIKNLWEKVKIMDCNVASQIEEIIHHDNRSDMEKNAKKENIVPDVESVLNSIPVEGVEVADGSEYVNSSLSREDNRSNQDNKKLQTGQMGQQSLQMLKVRAILEEKLKKRGVYDSNTPKSTKECSHASEARNRQMETLPDFDDDVTDGNVHHGMNSNLHKLMQTKIKKAMLVSGDDDLPMRDDLGEKRIKYVHKMVEKAEKQRKRELRALRRTEADLDGRVGDGTTAAGTQDDGLLESEDDFYKEVKRRRLTKLSTKAALYARIPALPSSLEGEAEGKRQITYQMEKNKGLTRNRKKLTKIPRKKYKLKHQKAVVRRKGQVRDIRQPSGPYGGEASGINTRVSRSIRFKS